MQMVERSPFVLRMQILSLGHIHTLRGTSRSSRRRLQCLQPSVQRV